MSVLLCRWLPSHVLSMLLIACSALSTATQAQPFDSAPRDLKIMTWNVEWMYDAYQGDNRSDLAREQSSPNREYWDAKVAGVAEVIASEAPYIVCLQEIENDQTLWEITNAIKAAQPSLQYRYAFIQGTDRHTEQDVGILMRGGLVAYGRREQSKPMFDSRNYYNLSKHILAEFRWADVDSPLTLLNVHFRAREEAEETRVKQAKLARVFVDEALQRDEDVIVLGDFNSEHPAGKNLGDIAALSGSGSQPKMIDLLTRLPDPRAATHLILDKQFDRIMVSESLLADGPGQDWVFTSIHIVTDPVFRGARDTAEHWDNRLTASFDELDISDHFPVVATFELK